MKSVPTSPRFLGEVGEFLRARRGRSRGLRHAPGNLPSHLPQGCPAPVMVTAAVSANPPGPVATTW